MEDSPAIKHLKNMYHEYRAFNSDGKLIDRIGVIVSESDGTRLLFNDCLSLVNDGILVIEEDFNITASTRCIRCRLSETGKAYFIALELL